jgi:hypothetical protein
VDADEKRLVALPLVAAIEEIDDLSGVSGPSSLRIGFLAVPSEDLHPRAGSGGVRQTSVSESTARGTSGTPGIGVFLHGGATACVVGFLLMSVKLTCCLASR